MQSKRSYIEQFSATKEDKGLFWDEEDRFIEDFDYPINLMIACSTIEIVEGNFEDVLKLIKP